MIDNSFIPKAKELVAKHDLQKYIDILLNYWNQNPPTLGHGLAHVLEVATTAYELGELNNYPEPQDLFIGGIFHDIYRPAEGEDADEDQSKGVEITANLLKENNIDDGIIEKIVGAMKAHDEWRGQEEVPIYDLILSTADKTTHSELITNSYVYASNKALIAKGLKPKYRSHLITLYGFIKYQNRAWEIFIKHPIKGTERAIATYLRSYEEVMNAYRNDPEGKDFDKYVEEKANKYREIENEALNTFCKDKEIIKNVTSLNY